MARANNQTTMILGLAAVGAGAAFFMSKKAHASDVKPGKDDTDKNDSDDTDTTDTDKLPDVDPKKEHATFGAPYIVGDMAKNVRIAVAQKPTVHPTGESRGSKDWPTWLANVVYWETWPADPVKIASSKSPEASRWKAAKAAVDLAMRPTGGNDTVTGHPTIGEPYRPGRANEQHNAATAADKRPSAHPVGLAQRKTPLATWLTNVAYWESYPLAPVVIPAGNSEWKKSWLRLQDMIKIALKEKPGDDPKKNPNTDKETGLFPTLGAPYRPGSDQERGNALLAVKLRPKTHPRGETQGAKDLATWLTNVAYWEVWPAAPTKITNPNGGLAASWKRIFAVVSKALKTSGTTTPTKPTKPSGTTTPTKPTKPGGTTTPTKPTKPSGTTTPTKPAAGWFAGDLDRNAAKAVNERTAEYQGRVPKPGDKAIDWLANVAYWATWPDAPVKITSAKDKLNVGRWKQARAAIAAISKGEIAGEGEAPPEVPTLPKDSAQGAEEIRNAALAVDATERGPDFIRRAATVAFNETYPQAKQDTAHKLAATRVLNHVQRGAALAKKLGPAPTNWPHKDGRRWTPFAIALACSSALRSPDVIRAAVEKAIEALNGSQVAVRGDEDLGSLLAATSQAIVLGKPLQNLDVTQYPQTRAFMACADLL